MKRFIHRLWRANELIWLLLAAALMSAMIFFSWAAKLLRSRSSSRIDLLIIRLFALICSSSVGFDCPSPIANNTTFVIKENKKTIHY